MLRQTMELPPTNPAPRTVERPRIETFEMHPLDYLDVQQAAALQGLSITDFVQLAVYLYSRDFLAKEKAQKAH